MIYWWSMFHIYVQVLEVKLHAKITGVYLRTENYIYIHIYIYTHIYIWDSGQIEPTKMALTPQHLGVEATQNWWFHQSMIHPATNWNMAGAKFVPKVKDGSRFLHVLTYMEICITSQQRLFKDLFVCRGARPLSVESPQEWILGFFSSSYLDSDHTP
jgi:hypothetical protein